MTNDDLERDLRAMLASRDPGSMSARLSAVVTERMAVEPVHRRWSAALRWAGATAAIALLIAFALAIGIVRPVARFDGPGTAAPLPLVPFDPSATGSGLVDRADGILWVALVAASLVAVAILARVIRGRWRRSGVILVGAFVALVVMSLSTVEAVDFHDGARQYGQGWIEPSPRAPDAVSPLEEDQRFQVPPNGILTFGFDVHNRTTLPITIVGVVPRPLGEEAWGRVVAAGLVRDPLAFDISAPASTRPFEATTVAPDQRLFLIIAGRASRCALAPGSPADPNGTGADLATVDVAYDIAGLRRVTRVRLPFVVDIPMDGACMAAR